MGTRRCRPNLSRARGTGRSRLGSQSIPAASRRAPHKGRGPAAGQPCGAPDGRPGWTGAASSSPQLWSASARALERQHRTDGDGLTRPRATRQGMLLSHRPSIHPRVLRPQARTRRERISDASCRHRRRTSAGHRDTPKPAEPRIRLLRSGLADVLEENEPTTEFCAEGIAIETPTRDDRRTRLRVNEVGVRDHRDPPTRGCETVRRPSAAHRLGPQLPTIGAP